MGGGPISTATALCSEAPRPPASVWGGQQAGCSLSKLSPPLCLAQGPTLTLCPNRSQLLHIIPPGSPLWLPIFHGSRLTWAPQASMLQPPLDQEPCRGRTPISTVTLATGPGLAQCRCTWRTLTGRGHAGSSGAFLVTCAPLQAHGQQLRWLPCLCWLRGAQELAGQGFWLAPSHTQCPPRAGQPQVDVAWVASPIGRQQVKPKSTGRASSSLLGKSAPRRKGSRCPVTKGHTQPGAARPLTYLAWCG